MKLPLPLKRVLFAVFRPRLMRRAERIELAKIANAFDLPPYTGSPTIPPHPHADALCWHALMEGGVKLRREQ